LAEAIADCALVVGTTAVKKRDLLHPLHRLEDGARLIGGRLSTGKVALLFGSEKVGLSNDALSHCHWLMRIPTRDAQSSMNLGQAVAICLYELIRETPAVAPVEDADRASAGEVERLTTVLFDVLRSTRYWNPGATSETEEKVRRLVRRLQLQSGDAEVMLGMLRQILWKLKAGEKGGV
jgi:tRNA/rRNA methyltransferase